MCESHKIFPHVGHLLKQNINIYNLDASQKCEIPRYSKVPPPLQVLAFGLLKGPTRGSGELPEGRTPKNLHMENLFLKSPLTGPTRGS